MKKMLSIMLALCLVLVLGACSQSDNVYESGEDEDVVEEEYSEETYDSGNALELVSRGTWTTEDNNGYKVQGEIETTDLIRASDWSTAESTFDTFNYPDSLSSFDVLSPDGANQDTSAVLIGMIELTNVTDGWDFTESSPYEYKLIFSAPDLYGYNASSLCVMYGDGMKKLDFGGVRGKLDTSAVMDSNTWKVPFIIVIPEVFTPNEPDGSANVLNVTLQIGGYAERCEFTMPSLAE